jgi:hypothetical protein
MNNAQSQKLRPMRVVDTYFAPRVESPHLKS